MSIPCSSSSQVHHVFDPVDCFLIETFDVDTFLDVFPDVQVVTLWIQQVHDLLVVNFQIAGLHQELHLNALFLSLNFFVFHAVKHVFKTALHETAHLVHLVFRCGRSDQRFLTIDEHSWTLDREGLA